MNILVINCGSSSIKYQLFDMPGASVTAKGMIEKVTDHREGLRAIAEALSSTDAAGDAGPVRAVGHRVVHGGERFTDSVVVTDAVIRQIEECADLAPLHNPPNLAGIRAAAALFPSAVQVACFDTAFHQTMPEHAYRYALPQEHYRKHKIRRYGFHGTSHRYVTERAAAFLGRDPATLNAITCHLGNGCSITAVRGGKSVDTSMGLTPLEGLVMGTRSGDVDPAILFHLVDNLGMGLDDAYETLNKRSGLLGLSGNSNDMRDILAGASAGDRAARLAVEVFCYRLKKYIGAYTAALGRVDALVFTGGIGENAAAIRSRACSELDALGICVDDGRNTAQGRRERDISPDGARVKVLVIPTNEEAAIARDTYALVCGKNDGGE